MKSSWENSALILAASATRLRLLCVVCLVCFVQRGYTQNIISLAAGPTQIVANEFDDTTISCTFHPDNALFSAIRWRYPNNVTTVYVYDSSSGGNPIALGNLTGRASHTHNTNNMTLTIQRITKYDKGTYYCEFVGGNVLNNSTGIDIAEGGYVTDSDKKNVVNDTKCKRKPNEKSNMISCSSSFRCAKPGFNLTLQLENTVTKKIVKKTQVPNQDCAEKYFQNVVLDMTAEIPEAVSVSVILEHISSGESQPIAIQKINAAKGGNWWVIVVVVVVVAVVLVAIIVIACVVKHKSKR